ncbi:Mediator complex, subunit Med17 [Artemisia annua]|uniref:Mediator of RNA polymerase II transcription subunit 17 n=1 Tax=Artemisia annua TaxID=35608 RepID=A0A2U1NY98_ARTAN|nr:Mediator complex, subunit Med17 [Artemisia annua]
MDGNLAISLDKLPVKRLEAIEENGAERFPPDLSYDDNRVNLIRRVDFAWAVEREDPKKKQKKGDDTAAASGSKDAASAPPWPWQNMVENLQLAHQELSVIIDLINTVEANDQVTVAGMTRPKPLPNELLSDLAVSTATKLQSFRHLGKYFKQSAKALEKQVAREARFYGALIRLQQNWKVKRHRMAASAAGNEGFYIDLFDNTLYDPTSVIRPTPLSSVRVEHDSAGMLALNLSSKACNPLQFGFVSGNSDNISEGSDRIDSELSGETNEEAEGDDASVKKRHSDLREVQRAVFDEQVFNLINQEAFVPSIGVNVTGIRENHLQLNIDQEASVFISLGSSAQDNEESDDKTAVIPFIDGEDKVQKRSFLPNTISSEILLKQLFHEHVFVRAKNRSSSPNKSQLSIQPPKDGSNLLGHFCLSLAHRIFSSKVLVELEELASSVSYVRLMSHPTWHSRTSAWTLVVDVPQSILHTGTVEKSVRSQFRTKVVVNDDCINIEGEGAPNVVGLFKGKSENSSSMNRYECNLADLHVILLRQVASQIIRWLHEEALIVGIKASRDFLSLSFEVEQGELVGLVAHVDPEDSEGGISWWLVMGKGIGDEYKLQREDSDGETKRFLGHLSLDVLYATLLDLVTLCNNGGSL